MFALLVMGASLWLLPRAQGQNFVDVPWFGPVFIADGESGRVVVYNTWNQTAVIDITFLNAADGTELVGSLKGFVLGPGAMAAAAYAEPVGGQFRTEVVGMVRVLQGNPTGLLSAFQLVESDGRTRITDVYSGVENPTTVRFAPVGLLNETGRVAVFNNSTKTAVLDLDIINIATNTLLATFKGGVLLPHSSISVQAVVGGTRTEVVGIVRVLSGSPIGLFPSFYVIGADNRTRFGVENPTTAH